MEGAKELSMEDRFREMAESIKAEIGPIPKPRLTWRDHVRFRMYRPRMRGMVTGMGFILVGTLLLSVWANTGGVASVTNLTGRYRMLPACEIQEQEKAGKSSTSYVDLIAIQERSKRFYCEGALDSLQANRDTLGIADYYVAQFHLKQLDWKAAQQGLEKCLSNSDFLQQFPNKFDPAEIRFNLLLARMGNGVQYEQLRSDLNHLLEDNTTGKMVKDNARALRAEMESPLRWFYFR
ncbi:MAG: hypothetical protein Q7T20_13650 [Saprospiraceae bacterium]|nr:hypothetical protein [Saprospiraceae bacterium]